MGARRTVIVVEVTRIMASSISYIAYLCIPIHTSVIPLHNSSEVSSFVIQVSYY
jgi:hypothetical protein